MPNNRTPNSRTIVNLLQLFLTIGIALIGNYLLQRIHVPQSSSIIEPFTFSLYMFKVCTKIGLGAGVLLAGYRFASSIVNTSIFR